MDWDCRLDCGLTGTGGSQNRPRTLFSSAKRPTPQLEPSSPHPTTVVATAPARHSIGSLVTQTKKGIPYPRYCLHLRNLLILLQFLLNSWLNSKNGSVKWNQNGNWVQTASKDQIIKIHERAAILLRGRRWLDSYYSIKIFICSFTYFKVHKLILVLYVAVHCSL